MQYFIHTTTERKKVADSDNEKADVLADYFSSLFNKESEEQSVFLEEVCTVKFDDNPFCREDIRKLLNELNVSKSPETDMIHTRVLSELAEVINTPLEMIHNRSFNSRYVPVGWK